MKEFMCWWGGGYPEGVMMKPIEWFDVDRGYDPHEVEEVFPELDIGETHVMECGDHIVTRVK